MPLKSGQTRKGLRNLSTGVSAIPDSVVYQWRAEDFADPWPANVSSVDMSVSGGLSQSTFDNGETSVTADGTDDEGTADGPQDLGSNATFGIALTIDFVAAGASSFQSFCWADDAPNPRLAVRESNDSNGNISFEMRDDNDNQISVYTNSDYSGSLRTVVINKNGDSDGDIDIYVDDMTSTVGVTRNGDGTAFDSSNYNISTIMGFFARNSSGSTDLHSEADVGVFEFNNEPYSQSEREAFVNRRPEV